MQHPIRGAFLAVLAVGLAGCAGMGPSQTMMSSRPMPMPQAPYASPEYPVRLPGPDENRGASLDEAYHQVQGYVTTHFPGSQLVNVAAEGLDPRGRIDPNGTWSFSYLIPEVASQDVPATASQQTQALDVTARFEEPVIAFRMDGNGRMLAPEAAHRFPAHPVPFAFDATLPIAKAVEAAVQGGMVQGPMGYALELGAGAGDRVVFTFDTTATYPASWLQQYAQTTKPAPGAYDPPSAPRPPVVPVIQLPLLGRFVVDARTGRVLETPERD